MHFDLPFTHYLALAGVAVIIGMSKTGVAGVFNLAILGMAWMFGSKSSTGIILPMLSMADVFAVIYYRRNAEWKYIWKVMPAALGGILVGVWVGKDLPEDQFRILLGATVLIGVAVMLWTDLRRDKSVPTHPAFAWATGWAGGFATMVGNSAGPIMSVYLLAIRLPKNAFIGTAAWFFLIINLFKMPFQFLAWGNISGELLLLDFMMLPAIALGAWLGIRIVKAIPDTAYRYFVMVVTALSAILLFI